MTYPVPPGGLPDQSWPPPQSYGDEAAKQSSPAAGYQQPYAAYPAYGYGPPMARPTNGLAIASLVCALAGLFTCGISSVVGAILGHVSRRQIRERGEDGDGLALAGIITGWIITGLYGLIGVLYAVAIGIAVSNSDYAMVLLG